MKIPVDERIILTRATGHNKRRKKQQKDGFYKSTHVGLVWVSDNLKKAVNIMQRGKNKHLFEF